MLDLLSSRRFAPLWVAQAASALADNALRAGLGVAALGPEPTPAGAALALAVFTGPWLLLAGPAGAWADRGDKARVIQAAQGLGLVAAAVAAAGFALEHDGLLWAALAGSGAQAAVLGPAKYAVLPQHLEPEELLDGNAGLQVGTWLAILAGTGLGALVPAVGPLLVVVAIAGLGAAAWVPPAPPEVRAPIPSPSLDALRRVADDVVRLRAALCIAWFWVVGGAVLSVLPTWGPAGLCPGPDTAGAALALFSVGVAGGAWVCSRLSGDRIELGLVPLGSLGMALFAADLAWTSGVADSCVAAGVGLPTLGGIRLAVDLVGLAAASALFAVPLYALLQERAGPEERGRVLAGVHLISALAMLLGAGALGALQAAGAATPVVFASLAVGTAIIAAITYATVPEFALRLITWGLSRVVYRIEVSGHELVPRTGPCVVVCNHVSFIDWFVLAATLRRPARFVMHVSFHRMPVVTWLFKQARTIPIAGHREDPELLERAFALMSEALREEQVVCLFPEGRITNTGELDTFRRGIERVLEADPVPVVPAALNGLWGSFFSRKDGRAMTKPFRRWWSRVWVTFGAPIPPGEASAEALGRAVEALWRRRPDHP